MNETNFKYILFDLDGTLTDPYEGISKSIRYALERLGEPDIEDNEIKKFIGPPLKDGYIINLGFSEEKAEKALSIYREHYCVTGVYENRLIEGTKELLSSLKKRGKTIVLATSKPYDLSEIVLEYFGITKYFDFLSCAVPEDPKRNEKTDIVKFALDNLNIDTAEKLSQTVIIGDRHYDINAAKATGIFSVGVLVGYGDINELREAGADFIVETLFEIEAYV